MAFYKMQIKAWNKTAHHILKKGVDLILPKFPKGWKGKEEFSVQLFQALLAWYLKEV